MWLKLITAIMWAQVAATRHTHEVFSNADGKLSLRTITLSALSDDVLVSGSYLGDNSLQGWNSLEVAGTMNSGTAEEYLTMRKAMGYLEGQLTCSDIVSFYPNFYSDMWGDAETPGDDTLDFIRSNYDWTLSMAEKNWQTDEYWFAQLGTLRQMEGMLDGLRSSPCLVQVQPSDKKWSWASVAVDPKIEQLLLINAWGDLYQIAMKVQDPTKDLTERLYGVGRHIKMQRCSAMVKVLPGNSDVLFAHNTWDGFEALGPRIFKHYSLPMIPSSSGSSSSSIVYDTYFSSSPLLLSSVDDFFVVNGRATLGVTETTNSLYNVKLLTKVVPESVLSWMRSTAANMLATSGSAWTGLFSRYQSGTYTNQWMVLDFGLFTPGVAPPAGFFSVLEEVPGQIVSQDMTSVLVDQSYWRSFNSPYFPAIQQASGYATLCKSGVDTACYEKAPRAVLFAEYQEGVTDVASMQAIMQYNNYTMDAASAGDSCQAIACRGDLESSNPTPMGALDAKLGSAALSKATPGQPFRPTMFAHLGPATSGGSLPKFCWTAFDQGAKKFSHVGQPDCFDFDWQTFGNM